MGLLVFVTRKEFVKVLCGYSVQKGLKQSSAVILRFSSSEEVHSCIIKHAGSPHWLQLLTVSASVARVDFVSMVRAHLFIYIYYACATSMLLHERKCNIGYVALGLMLTLGLRPRVNINPSCNVTDIALPLM